jgi:hypothetical protein
VFGAKRLSDVRYLKQNNETKIASGFKLYNKVFDVCGPEKDVNLLRIPEPLKTSHAGPV